MINVAVCDDNKIFLDEFEQILQKHSQVESVSAFSDYESLKDSVLNNNEYDIIFMDIDFGEEKNGIDFASELFNFSPDSGIIYVTCHRDRYTQQIFLEKTNLLGYLLKPVDWNLLVRYLDMAVQNKKKRGYLSLTVKGKDKHIRCDKILWVESHNHTSVVYFENEKLVVYEKLGFILERLPANFVQCHKSYAVNMDFIDVLEGTCVYLVGGFKIPVSRSFKSSLRSRFFSFIGGKI